MRIIIVLISVVFLFGAIGSSAYAVERKEKKAKAKIEDKKPDKKAGATDSSAKDQKKAPKKFDSFIDRNGNGIDDRKEKLVPKKSDSELASKKADSDKKADEKQQSARKKTSDKKADEKKD